MDWESLIADEGLWLDRHYTEGRSGHAIEGVTVHHMAGDLSLADCHRVWQAAPTSAHYAVDRDGRVAQMVHDRDTAWACGDWDANCRTISVEHANSGSGPWTVHEAAMEAGAHLVAAICLAYGLGRPEWGTNVWPHCHWAATACPGELWGSQRDDYMARCQRWYDAMASGGGEWVREADGRWWRRHADGSFASGWERVDGSWFLFDASGWMLTGWQSVGGRWYYLCEEEGRDLGRMLVGWQMVSGRWYYMDPATGAMATDWVRDGGRWYWLDPATGAMVASSVREVGGRAYAFGEDGAMLEGELTFLTDEGGALARRVTVGPEGASDGRA